MSIIVKSIIPGLRPVYRNETRDVYDIGEHHYLIVNTDRISAFGVVLPTPIPGKGKALTRLCDFWFERTEHIVPNHRVDIPIDAVTEDPETAAQLADRSLVVRKAQPLRIEVTVSGYLTGSTWIEYRETGKICDVVLPRGLRESEKLPSPLFTYSNKAPRGHPDKNIALSQAVEMIGSKQAALVREISIALYKQSSAQAEARGIIIADAKFTFGMTDGELVLTDELLTPDSSRFFEAEKYSPGCSPPSFAKEFVHNYLDSYGWDKKRQAPELPPEIATQTSDRYRELLERLAWPATYIWKN
ncbi:MAG: phosphoribosylaminoimidazolesuccinocarboxamide synthase [Deltaproteobacteria bacterium]|nr:phosphoribosylaminoimidazolesuccinocarboxamide synthase [Deltaproteobacteria bacterium]